LLCAQQSQPPAQAGQIKTGAEEVVVDLVARDKKGHPVLDLKPGDVTVLDNGQQKAIKSFRLVQGAEAVNGQGVRMQLDPLRQVRLVSLVFDNLDLNSRRLARSAALDLLKTDLPQNVYMAIFTMAHKLYAIQQFTNDRDLLRKAIERATSAQETDFSSDSQHIETQLQTMIGAGPAGNQTTSEQIANMPTGATSSTGTGATPNGAAIANQAMAQVMLGILEADRQMATVQTGRAQIFGLLDLVQDQYRLPGRKTVLFFSTGLNLPQSADEAFQNLIATANRNNVSVYCVDARGLTIEATNTDAVRALNSAVSASQHQQTTNTLTAEGSRAMDTSLNSMRMNTQENLASLAESTGGTLIANTNDFRNPLRKMAEDIETYYEIAYDPQISNYDGSFHKIVVKSDLADVRLQARSGYFALPPEMLTAGMIHAYEVPLLKALDQIPPPRTFRFSADGLHFRGPQGQSVCDLVIDVPLSDITFEHSKSGDENDAGIAYEAVLKDDKGTVIKKFTNQIPMNVPDAKLPALKESHFIYTDHFDLTPGHYRLEAAVMDRQGNKISARKAALFMPEFNQALAMSSVVPVRNMKPKGTTADATDPLLIGNEVVGPTLSPDISKKEANGMSFYVVVYPDKSIAEEPKLTLEFSKDGQVIGTGSPELGSPDPTGKIQYIATTPIAQMQAGDYQVRFVASQGKSAVQQTVAFKLEQ
jgi:VWFA-related protein